MTRETKLALIIGFALILAVGVLISDHLAAVERAGPADLTVGSQREEVGTHLALAPPLMEVDRRGDEPAGREVGAERAEPEILPHQREAQPRDEAAAPEPEGSSPSIASMFSPVDGDGPVVVRQVPPREERARGGQDERSVRAQPPARRPKTTTHVVREDESLWEIAEQYYGDGTKWRKLAAANSSAVNDDGHVRVGVELTIPDVEPPTADARSPEPETRRGASRPEGRMAARRTYTVQRGDTLSEIAMRELGSAKRTREILDLNRDRIDEADEIRVGMVLRLPAK